MNRIHKILQDANIKLSSVITDIMGKSGQEMLEKIIAGEMDAAKIAECAHGKMKAKKDDLVRALESGKEYFNNMDKEKIIKSMVKRIEKIGYKVELSKVEQPEQQKAA